MVNKALAKAFAPPGNIDASLGRESTAYGTKKGRSLQYPLRQGTNVKEPDKAAGRLAGAAKVLAGNKGFTR